MSAPTNHWKLGLFVVVSLLAGLGGAVYIGARTLKQDTVRYVSYFDEAVSGLSLGSSVSFRGVTIGTVTDIDVAPDRRHVEIEYELGVQEIERLGLATKRGQKTRFRVPPDIRVQLSTTGITGNKFVKLDFFDPEKYPVPELPFPVPTNTIPAVPSTMKNLEDAMVRSLDALPEILAQIMVAAQHTQRVLGQIEEEQIPQRAGAALAHAERAFAALDRDLRAVDMAGLSKQGHEALENLNTTLVKVHGIMARLDGDHGLLASVERATDSVGDLAVGARGVGTELDGTLRDLRDAAESVRLLVDAIERQPDMLVKGRARAQR